ncbi:MAG: hypothetical protein ACE5GD_07050 [Candidatus Geothermarchaeales archaeon]
MIGERYVAPSYGEEVILKVVSDVQDDESSGLARLCSGAREKLGVDVGESIEIMGAFTTRATVGKLEEITQEKEAISISKELREKIPVEVGTKVFVRKALE